jgi:hypothetical protein
MPSELMVHTTDLVKPASCLGSVHASGEQDVRAGVAPYLSKSDADAMAWLLHLLARAAAVAFSLQKHLAHGCAHSKPN